MRRKITYGLFGITTWHPCRVRLPFRKPLPIVTFFDGTDWYASCADGLISAGTDIYDPADKTEAATIKSLRHKIAGIATEDASLYRRGGFTEKGRECYRVERDAIKEYLPEGWFEFVEKADKRMPVRIPKEGFPDYVKENSRN